MFESHPPPYPEEPPPFCGDLPDDPLLSQGNGHARGAGAVCDPLAIEAQRVIIGTILRHPERFQQVADLDPDVFSNKGLRAVFSAIVATTAEGSEINTFEVSRRLGTKFNAPVSYLEKLRSDGVPVSSTAAHRDYLLQLHHAGAVRKRLDRITALAQRGDVAGVRAEAEGLDATTAPQPNGLSILSASDIELNAIKTNWLIHGIRECDTTSVIFGESGSKKSFIEIDQLFCIATGKPYHGRAVKRGAVLYVAGEGGLGIKKRIAGLAQFHGIPLTKARDFLFTTQAVEFLNPASIAELRQKISVIVGDRPLLAIAIDTLSRNYGPGDENSNTDMAKFVAEMDRLRTQFGGSSVSVVHHTGHGDKSRERGAVALRANTDWRWLVSSNANGTTTMACLKSKDLELPSAVSFEPLKIFLEGIVEESGEKVTTLVMRETEARPEEPGRKLSGNALLALQALEYLFNGEAPLHLELWRQEFYRRSPADNVEAKKKAFQRARTDLLDQGKIEVSDDHYWLSGRPGHIGTNRDIVPSVPGQPGHTPLGVSRCPA